MEPVFSHGCFVLPFVEHCDKQGNKKWKEFVDGARGVWDTSAQRYVSVLQNACDHVAKLVLHHLCLHRLQNVSCFSWAMLSSVSCRRLLSITDLWPHVFARSLLSTLHSKWIEVV